MQRRVESSSIRPVIPIADLDIDLLIIEVINDPINEINERRLTFRQKRDLIFRKRRKRKKKPIDKS